MRFELTSQLALPPDEVVACYTDPDFYARLDGLPNVGEPRVLDRTERGDTVTMRVHYRFTRVLSAGVAKVVDPAKISWVEETEWDRTTCSARSILLPDNYADRFSASAQRLHTAADGGTLRRISGEVRVRFPVVGGKVERAIVEGLEEYLRAEAERVTA
ncbi:MAG: DUF2505 family protein [Acidimicrobiales bacterium]